jgi:hypothetical protein
MLYVIAAVISSPSPCASPLLSSTKHKSPTQHLPLRNDDQKSSTLTATSLDAAQTQLQQPTDEP